MNESPDPLLTGRRIVVTRPRDQSGQLREQLERLGARVISFPTIKIVPARDAAPREAALQRIRQYDWILLTSRNAVDAVARATKANAAEALGEVPIAVVGMATLRHLTDLGIHADFVPSQFNMATLCTELIQTANVDGQRFLYPCGYRADAPGPQTFRAAGRQHHLTSSPQQGSSSLRSSSGSSLRLMASSSSDTSYHDLSRSLTFFPGRYRAAEVHLLSRMDHM